MLTHWQTTGRIALLAACSWMAALSYPANAQQEGSVVLPPPAGAEEAPATGPAMVTPPAACCSIGAPVQPCIEYRTHLSARRAYRCTGEKPVTVMARNPVDCLDYEVPLCIPCRCEGEPCVTSECGLLGRGRVEYLWDCGFSAIVVFKGCNDIKVHYRG
jgi:hypothetical protein